MKSLAFFVPLMAVVCYAGAEPIGAQGAPSRGPAARVGVGPWSLSARVGPTGVEVRVDPKTRRTPSTPPARSRTSGSARASRVLATADDYVGTRYVYGGTTPKGFDCSGFVQYVFRRHGVTLPRTSRQQARAGTRAPRDPDALRPGDLLLFATSGKQIDHVAIYAGENRIIHSSASGGGVRYDKLSTTRGKWFARHHVASRRVLADARALAADLRAVEASIALTVAPLDAPDAAPPP
jgi:cell wall-associated NlpC family hydrolase